MADFRIRSTTFDIKYVGVSSSIQSLSSTLADSFLGRQIAHSQINKFKLDASHNRKFQSLHTQQESELTNNSDNHQIRSNTEKWFVNTTDMEIPTEIIETLALGPRFGQPNSLDKTSSIETVKNIEQLLDTHELDEQLAWALRSHIVVKKKPLSDLQSNVRNILHKWNELRYLGRIFHEWALTRTDTNLAKIYGSPKVHKAGIPLRPIVSAVGTPTYFMSKVVDRILKSAIPKSSSYMKNSNHFIQQIKEINIPSDHVLVEFDVISMYPNIPLDLVLLAAEKRFKYIREKHDITLQELLDAIKFLMENTYFTFGGQTYHQKHGTSMGSPCSPTFADIGMVDLEESCL
ncbi:hypothetical protein QAD02_003637 [Eretmocerus hayati]|uniref:Uncharacterized protein n=1 Tax=Eretmocerus hayati TaxID=131215 RepID=A0ACC2NNI5_9HYME|nr:hypothetical protein QAD02_003637 [Eretmocerus hayati]